ncbi:hypothetical protein ALC57_16325 [Trachymyrmex cornetzi]|uniref:Uncharacterized protein n=1 Tax=Trachymyrmex cornetzi TaxID=471704 RepID=A0A195DFA3_9HYME|nr:hypothetical protein ALC57_16325 [Trachymyrmex cornetzi]
MLLRGRADERQADERNKARHKRAMRSANVSFDFELRQPESVVKRHDGDDVPGRMRFKSERVRSRLLDWTKELECAKFGVNATLATAKAYTKQAKTYRK